MYNITFAIQSFHCIGLDSTANDIRGMLVLIRNTIQYTIIESQFNFLLSRKILAIQIKLKDTELAIIDTYRIFIPPLPNQNLDSFRTSLAHFNTIFCW